MKRFADSFVICGLNSELGLERNKVQNENCEYLPPLDRSYKSYLLKCYPDNQLQDDLDDDEDAILMMCLPSGLKFRASKSELKSPSPIFHSFVITRKNASRLYGFSLVFDEKVTDSRICQAMHTLQSMYLTELSTKGLRSMSSFVENTWNSMSRSLPRNFKIHQRRHTGTSSCGSRGASYYDISQDQLYVNKSIAILSRLNYVQMAKQFLMHFYSYVTNLEQNYLTPDSYLYNLLYELEVPSPGYSLLIHLPRITANFDSSIIVYNAANDQLPNFDYFFSQLFIYLGVDCVLQLFTCAILEKQILLRSNDYEKLMTVSECITCLLYPFEWLHVYVPILPMQMYHFLDAPVPFLMGLINDSNYHKDVMPTASHLCLVDIDKGTLQYPEDIPIFPHYNEFRNEILTILDHHDVNFRATGTDRFKLFDEIQKFSSNSNSLPHSNHFRVRKASLVEILDWDSSRPPSPPGSARIQVLQKISKIVEKQSGQHFDNKIEPKSNNSYLNELKFNNAIRQVFLNRFVHLFHNFENFLIHINGLNCDDDNFDKVAFLSDQPEEFIPFLSRFLESQMFLNFVEQKINETASVKVFDNEVSKLMEKNSHQMISSYQPCTSIERTQRIIVEKLTNADFESVVSFKEVIPTKKTNNYNLWQFNNDILDKRPFRTRNNSIRRSKIKSDTQSIDINTSLLTLNLQHSNQNFIEKLLKDCKIKTKRMLLMKLRDYEDNVQNEDCLSIEENSQITSLCDYLERVWSHGLRRKVGKSALWSHLSTFQNDQMQGQQQLDQLCGVFMKPVKLAKLTMTTTAASAASATSRRVQCDALSPLPNSLLYDLMNIQSMSDVKTHMGMSRAWIRLALEKKLLSTHLQTLLSNQHILKSLYKTSAFLRTEEEKEQFLFHLFSLNAVDYFPFTNCYRTTIIPYQIFINLTKRSLSLATNVWIIVSGSLDETKPINIHGERIHFVFRHRNLGILTSLRIGLTDNTVAMKWMIEYILIRNEISGHTYKFPCGRWLGRDIDDGSTERLLIAHLLPVSQSNAICGGRRKQSSQVQQPQRNRSPATISITANRLQNLLGDSINKIMKWHCSNRRVKTTDSLTSLFCGPDGLVQCLEQIFLYGFQSSRIFGRNLFLWDFFLKVKEYFIQDQQVDFVDDTQLLKMHKKDNYLAKKYFIRLLDEIDNRTNNSLGKDGKFQLLVCLSVRDHYLHRILEPLAFCTATVDLYDEKSSFLRNRSLFTFLRQILQKLDDINVVLDKSISHNIDVISVC